MNELPTVIPLPLPDDDESLVWLRAVADAGRTATAPGPAAGWFRARDEVVRDELHFRAYLLVLRTASRLCEHIGVPSPAGDADEAGGPEEPTEAESERHRAGASRLRHCFADVPPDGV